MDDTNNYKEVYFSQYCNTCKHVSITEESEDFDICNDCLNVPARQNTHKPLNWEEKA